MNKILVLGTGIQGKAAIHDLVASPSVTEVIAADANLDDLLDFASTLATDKLTCVKVDANDSQEMSNLMAGVDVVIMLLPTTFGAPLIRIAVDNGVHWVDASYAKPEYHALHKDAQSAGVAILPEFGLDPGIDLLLAAVAIEEFDEIHEFHCYGTGIPELSAADNALRYRISWTFDGVLKGYSRPARIIKEGRPLDIPVEDLFHNSNINTVEVAGVGELEAYFNGDAVRYVEMLGLQNIRESARYSMRWPGHASFWHKMSQLGFLSQEVLPDSQVSPRTFLRELLEPQLQYGPEQRDIALVRVDVMGLIDDQPTKLIYQVLDYRDLRTGFLAMQRTVGFTASIGAQMLLNGSITKRGLLSPLSDVPANLALAELKKRGIQVSAKKQVWKK